MRNIIPFKIIISNVKAQNANNTYFDHFWTWNPLRGLNSVWILQTLLKFHIGIIFYHYIYHGSISGFNQDPVNTQHLKYPNFTPFLVTRLEGALTNRYCPSFVEHFFNSVPWLSQFVCMKVGRTVIKKSPELDSWKKVVVPKWTKYDHNSYYTMHVVYFQKNVEICQNLNFGFNFIFYVFMFYYTF